MASQSDIKVPVLHHINLKTLRLQDMLDWYGTVVGLTVSHQFPGGAWATNDAANHRIAFLTHPDFTEDSQKIEHTGMHHVAFEYDSLDDLLESWERLDGLGIEPHMSLDHGLTTSIYYVDPDGNSVELQSDNFGDWAKSSAYLKTSEAFAANPIGTPIDPAAMLAARRSGVSVADVQARAYAGDYPPVKVMDPSLPFPVA